MKSQQRNREYEEYLVSDDWMEKRKLAYEAADYRCATCGKKRSLNAHHLVYRNLHDVDPITELLVLCKKCHKIAHIVNTKNKSRYEAIQRITKHIKMRKKQKNVAIRANKIGAKAQRKRDAWLEWLEANKYQDSNEFWVVDIEDLKSFLQI